MKTDWIWASREGLALKPAFENIFSYAAQAGDTMQIQERTICDLTASVDCPQTRSRATSVTQISLPDIIPA
jgi:hypothetical protein